MTRRIVAAGTVVLAVVSVCVSVARAEWPRHVAKPKALPGIPGYDYRPSNVTPVSTATVISLDQVPVIPPPGVTATQATRMYQLRETRLQVDHCFLSRVAVALHDDGFYQISYRADQNPQQVPDLRSPLKQGERLEIPLQTSQLKRNLFVVKVRAYTAAPTRAELPNLVPAPPAVIEFPVQQFWVQRGEPASKQFDGYSAAVKTYYPKIDRIEVEFTYK